MTESGVAVIALLADQPEVIPTLGAWFRAEWPEHFRGRDAAEIEREFRGDLHRDRLPARLIALVEGEIAGTIAVREEALESHPGYGPALGGLYVPEPMRGKGIGSALVRAGVDLAAQLGYPTIYTATGSAGGIVESLGWARLRSVIHEGETVTFYRFSRGVAR